MRGNKFELSDLVAGEYRARQIIPLDPETFALPHRSVARGRNSSGVGDPAPASGAMDSQSDSTPTDFNVPLGNTEVTWIF
ncbi:MAG: hypothetical protein CM15mP84_08700 [Cellvibrionales bacterium]|nr:MAG: hypothetical protein CM15mP84_08700 [Cellvibrionales bacterium]